MNAKNLHQNFVGLFADLYDASATHGDILLAMLALLADAYASMAPSAFASWVAEEFGTGGRPSKDESYKEGRLPKALREQQGIMSSNARKAEGDANDPARVNTTFSRLRIIAKAKAERPTFDLDRPFRTCYDDARGETGKKANKAKRRDKSAEKPGAVVEFDAQQLAKDVQSHPAVALEALCSMFRARKDAIRLAATESLRAGLVAAK